jgi:hypothetical protein
MSDDGSEKEHTEEGGCAPYFEAVGDFVFVLANREGFVPIQVDSADAAGVFRGWG